MRIATKLILPLLVAGLTLSIASGVRAQETPKEEIIRPITKAGSAAFLFTLSGLGTFGIGAPSINGMASGVGAKWFVADDIAIRLLVGLSSTQKFDTITTNLTTTTIGIGVGGEYHFRPLYSTSPYVGAQIGYTSMSHDIDTRSPLTTPANVIKIESDKTTSFGLGVLAGFDWFFARGFAIGAEMGLGFQSNGGTNPDGSSKTSSTTIALGTNSNVHFVVYF